MTVERPFGRATPGRMLWRTSALAANDQRPGLLVVLMEEAASP